MINKINFTGKFIYTENIPESIRDIKQNNYPNSNVCSNLKVKRLIENTPFFQDITDYGDVYIKTSTSDHKNNEGKYNGCIDIAFQDKYDENPNKMCIMQINTNSPYKLGVFDNLHKALRKLTTFSALKEQAEKNSNWVQLNDDNECRGFAIFA